MDTLTWEHERERIRKDARERHNRLSRLFKEDRLAFERERKGMIDEVIDRVEDEEQRHRLRALQADWDRKMRGAGSPHNRFVLAQTFFWDYFCETWQPAVQQLNSILNGKSQ